MENHFERPDYVFEISWEICNKVGGINTVLSTKALTMVNEWGDQFIMIGPDIWKGSNEHLEFAEDKNLLSGWKSHAAMLGLKIKTGRWKTTGNPCVILIDFTPFYTKRDEIFRDLWLRCKVDSISGQWDYIEPALFGYAAGKVIESFYHYHLTFSDKIVAHFHEWLTGVGIHYLEEHVPQIGTIFTTHATTVGRCIAGNGLPLYSKFATYNGDQVAKTYSIVAKHSLEKITAAHADCFTTVSEITAKECKQFLEKEPDIITPNGFEDYIVPDVFFFEEKRILSRKKLFEVATALTGQSFPGDTMLLLKSGRYEFRNKGIDLFIDAMGKLNQDTGFQKDLIAFIFVPAHQTGPRQEVLERLGKSNPDEINEDKILTHHLQGAESDLILNRIKHNGLFNKKENKIKIVFAPVYLDGYDGIFNMPYYDMLVGFDLSAFPSYYEPWGYTPLESLAFHIPTITTNVTGFGMILGSASTHIGEGMCVIERNDNNELEAVNKIATVVKDYSAIKAEEIKAARDAAAKISKNALWKNYILNYKHAYHISIAKAGSRAKTFVHEGGAMFHKLESTDEESKITVPIWREIFVQSQLPESLKILDKIARNLWWSWNYSAWKLFEMCDKIHWQRSEYNPIVLLESLSYTHLRRLEKSKEFIDYMNEVDKQFEEYMHRPFNESPQIAYFCMEYGIDNHLKLYSGGLGILAGDFLKEASDSASNIIGIGLLYREGYFKQGISSQNEQLILERSQNLTTLPFHHVYDSDGNWLHVSLAFPGRTLYARVWKVEIGKIPLYLLDADIPQNWLEDRHITSHLYGGDTENRLKQELLLGIGGVRLLRKLNLNPAVYHYNEGHAAFAGLERLLSLVQSSNLSCDEALEIVRASSLFTTHTAVPAGHDAFPEDLLRIYLSFHANLLNISWKRLMGLGRFDENDSSEKFSMSFLAARFSQKINSVSRIHEKVSKGLFSKLWKGYAQEELSIGHVTNGIHYSSWLANGWKQLYEELFTENFTGEQQNAILWQKIMDVPDSRIWDIHLGCKNILLDEIKKRFKDGIDGMGGVKDSIEAENILNENTLIIGFARRFVTYKRPKLLFTNLSKLSDILRNKEKPVLLLFAGKSHPSDKEAQDLIKYVLEMSENPQLQGHILFLSDYDMQMAKYLTSGVDVWLNTPEQNLEASGTSGMKAAVNGVLNLSSLDGWWAEAYREGMGWAIPSFTRLDGNLESINMTDAGELYRLLQNTIIPCYFERGKDNIPAQWITFIKKCIASIGPVYSMKRVLEEYRKKYYNELSIQSSLLMADGYREAKKISAWKNNFLNKWDKVKVVSLEMYDSANRALPIGAELTPRLGLTMDELNEEDIGVEIVFSAKRKNREDFGKIVFKKELLPATSHDHVVIYECKVPITKTGIFEYGFRIFPKNPMLKDRQDFPILKWV